MAHPTAKDIEWLLWKGKPTSPAQMGCRTQLGRRAALRSGNVRFPAEKCGPCGPVNVGSEDSRRSGHQAALSLSLSTTLMFSCMDSSWSWIRWRGSARWRLSRRGTLGTVGSGRGLRLWRHRVGLGPSRRAGAQRVVNMSREQPTGPRRRLGTGHEAAVAGQRLGVATAQVSFKQGAIFGQRFSFSTFRAASQRSRGNL